MVATSNRNIAILTLIIGGAAFVIGLLIGLYAPKSPAPAPASSSEPNQDLLMSKLTREADTSVSQAMIDGINADNIDSNLKKLSERPHIGGKADEDDTYSFVRDQWIQQGYDVHTEEYDVLLSYPEENHNNTAKLISSDGSVLYTSSSREHAYFDDEAHPEAVQPFNGFSPSGLVEADLVYANYARDEDFEKLAEMSINITGKIVIARYGKLFRGNKVLKAYNHGAIGIILFMDPHDYLVGDRTYPETIWLPPTGVQRGNIVLVKGDQATPGYPSKWYTERMSDEELREKLPKIPCHPIGYGDAYHLLREMAGREAPADWQGGLNITYKIGGSMSANQKVRVEVRNRLQTVTIKNIFATIKGSIESDKVVLVGNHRDAWVYGGADPSSATATILEVTRVYAEQVKKGWEPRRTVMFCSWDAEEYGLVGSYEWVEDNVKWLQNRAVAYLNVDSLTTGNYSLYVSATPTMHKAVVRATKKVPDPFQSGKSVFDVWVEKNEVTSDGHPRIYLPGGGSDFVPFEQDISIPTTGFGYQDFDLGGTVKRTFYPLYHTLYDGYRFAAMLDPGFKRCKAAGSYLVELTRDVVDSPILPFDARDYAKTVAEYVDGLFTANQQGFVTWNITRDGVQSAVNNFTNAANKFHDDLDHINKQNPIEVRAANERLMTLEKAFQIHTGLPGRPEFKHVLLSPSTANYYSTTTFPGMADLLYQIGENPTRWRQAKKHLSEIAFTIQSAAKILVT